MARAIQVLKSDHQVEFLEAVEFMNGKVKEIIETQNLGYLWFLEHPSIYTAGVTANDNDLLTPGRFPTYSTNRGGKYTYHGPGQRIIYLMLNLKQIQSVPDIKKFIHDIEEVLILTLKDFGIIGERRKGRIGIWVMHDNTESKIAAIGIRLKNWVTYHGISINVSPDLEHFSGIVPCGISEYGVTSVENFKGKVSLDLLDTTFCKYFQSVFKLGLITK